jgi:Dodecin
MALIKVIEVLTESPNSWEEAAQKAVKDQCHQDKVLLRRPLNIQSGFVSI